MLLNGRHCLIANAGDSRCIVVNDMGIGRQMTVDSKPTEPEELDRIKSCGGKVRTI